MTYKKMTYKNVLRTVSATAVLFGVALFSSPPPVMAASSSAVSSNSDVGNAVRAEFKELRSLTNQLDNDADQLISVAQSSRAWQTHASSLNQVKDHVNRIGERLEALQTMRYMADPWQQEMIDRVVPVAEQIADSTTAAISHMNQNRVHLWAPEYVDHLRNIAALSDDMHELVANHVQLIDARDKLQQLEEKLAERAS